MTSQAVVVGGGPAGLSAALGLHRAGRRVIVLEQRHGWLGRVCGAFLDGEAERHLRWLGVWDAVRPHGNRVTRVRVSLRNRAAVVPFPAPLWAVSRRDLEEALLKAVRDTGVEARTGSRVLDRRPGNGGFRILTAAGERIPAGTVVLASGRFADGVPASTRWTWYGWSADFQRLDQSSDELTMFFYPGGYVGSVVFPDGTGHIAGLVRRRGNPLVWDAVHEDARRLCPGYRRLTDGAVRVSPWRGVGPLPFGRRRLGADIRVGDAAAVGDPFMGEGIGRALAAGPMIHEAIREAEDPQEEARVYADLWRRTYRGRMAAGAVLRAVLDRDWAADFLLGILVARPRWIQKLLPLFHGGYR